jgi:hypothetical protein
MVKIGWAEDALYFCYAPDWGGARGDTHSKAVKHIKQADGAF